MKDSTALRSGVSGVVIGGLFACGMWLLDVSLVVMSVTEIVWIVAAGSSVYVREHYDGAKEAGSWGAIIGGSLLFTAVLVLSDIPMLSDPGAALCVLAVGFALLGYATGIATVYRHGGTIRTAGETTAET